MPVDVTAPEWSFGRDGARVSFLVPSIQDAQGLCDMFDGKKQYELSVKAKVKKRSLSANALLWALLGDIAVVLQKNDPKANADDLYRKYIHESNNYITQECRAEDFPKLEGIWRSNGIGWVCDVVDVDETGDGLRLTCRMYYGSSQYDTKEFSRLVESVLTDARELGIDHTSQAMRALMEQYPGGQ